MKTIKIFLIITSALFLALFSCSSGNSDSEISKEDKSTTSTDTQTLEDSNKINLVFPTFEDGQHKYYLEILEKSLKNSGADFSIKLTMEIPQTRATYMLDKGQINIFYYVQSTERDRKYIPIDVQLTDKMVGKRVFFVRKEDRELFKNVQSLDDFRKMNKIGAMGQDWYDIFVWQKNDLKYFEVSGNWREIYDMLGAKTNGIDYFSRGINEILSESKMHPDLAIEPYITLIYNRDYKFYMHPSMKKHKQTIEEALLKSQKNGLMKKMINKYWKETYKELNYSKRKKLYLETPL